MQWLLTLDDASPPPLRSGEGWGGGGSGSRWRIRMAAKKAQKGQSPFCAFCAFSRRFLL